MNSITVSAPLHRLCWFCQGKCNNFISICNVCEIDIKKRKSLKQKHNSENFHKNTGRKLG
jgi:hypothetical protein